MNDKKEAVYEARDCLYNWERQILCTCDSPKSLSMNNCFDNKCFRLLPAIAALAATANDDDHHFQLPRRISAQHTEKLINFAASDCGY